MPKPTPQSKNAPLHEGPKVTEPTFQGEIPKGVDVGQETVLYRWAEVVIDPRHNPPTMFKLWVNDGRGHLPVEGPLRTDLWQLVKGTKPAVQTPYTLILVRGVGQDYQLYELKTAIQGHHDMPLEHN